MIIVNEASPYIETTGDTIARTEVYRKHFSPQMLGNMKGTMPLIGVDFRETEGAYAKRLRVWKQDENEILFAGWTVKDMKQFQIATNKAGDSIQFDFNTYSITSAGRNYAFPTLPENVDDFINDCKRIGMKLFWKQEIIDKFGADKITSDKKVMEFSKMIEQIAANAGFKGRK